MKRIVPAWLLQLVWFLDGIFATGALWYFLSRDDILSATFSFGGAVVLTVVAILLHRLNDKDSRFRVRREKLAQFMKEAEALLKRSNEQPLPIQEHNEWVTRVEGYLNDEMDSSYATRFGNFSGITFYGDGSERSSFKNSLQGRSKRLHEFISESSE